MSVSDSSSETKSHPIEIYKIRIMIFSTSFGAKKVNKLAVNSKK
jgi:hypothetical protein